MNVITITKFSVISLIFVVGFSLFNFNPISAVEYTNHTNDKFKISFEYPTDWTVEEPTSRFDDKKIEIYSSDLFDAKFIISLSEDPITSYGSNNIDGATNKLKDGLLILGSSMFNIKLIEKISSLKIGGEDSRTFLLSMDEKYKDDIALGIQHWVVFIDKEKGYTISYMQPTTKFDNPESIEIRDHFINSIKFL